MQYETYISGNWLFLDFDLFQRLTRANRSRRSLKKIQERRSTVAIISFSKKRGRNCQKHTLVIWERFAQTTSVKISLLFFKDRRVDSLTVDLFQRSTRPIQARSIFFKDRKERKRIERSKDRIPNPEENRPLMEWFSNALLHTACWCGTGLRITAKRIRMIQHLPTSTDLMPAWAILFLVIMEAFQEEALATTFMHWYEVCHKKQYPGQLCQQKLRNISYILS